MTEPDVLTRIEQFNAGREPERLAMKYAALRENPFRFFRGTAHLFWDRWSEEPSDLDESPAAWSCGDLHLENFGSYRGDNRLAYFDINDFDDAALAPATRDPGRFLTSIHIAAAMLELTHSEVTELSKRFMTAYAEALADGKARWVERATAQGMVRDLLRRVKGRTREALLDTRTALVRNRRRLTVDGRHTLTASREDRRHVAACLEAFAESQDDPRFFKVLDVARRVAGTGSLGVRRFVVLVRGRGSPDGNFLIDLKEAAPSAIASRLQLPQPAWENEAARVVHVQQRMQAIAPALLRAVVMDGRHYILRELQPLEDRLALEHWNGKLRRLRRVMVTMGHVVAWSQLRSASRGGSARADELMKFAHSKSWHRALLARATQFSKEVRRDWQSFVVAHEDGHFAPGTPRPLKGVETAG